MTGQVRVVISCAESCPGRQGVFGWRLRSLENVTYFILSCITTN